MRNISQSRLLAGFLLVGLLVQVSVGFNSVAFAKPSAVLNAVTGEKIVPSVAPQPIDEIEPVPVVQKKAGTAGNGNGIGTISLNPLTSLGGNNYAADGTWGPTANCWVPGQDGTFQYYIEIVDASNGNDLLATVSPAPCFGDWQTPVDNAFKNVGGNWPGNGQTGNTFSLAAGEHNICAILRHASGNGQDIATSNCIGISIQPEQCVNPLDYVNTQGVTSPDGAITLSDAVIFTGYYMANDLNADVNENGIVDYGDYLCASQYISTATYACPLNCQDYEPVCGDTHVDDGEQCDDGNTRSNDGCNSVCQDEGPDDVVICVSPLDYVNGQGVVGADWNISISDATVFTGYYETLDLKADINNDSVVDIKDYLCAQPYFTGEKAYACQIDCSDLCVSPVDYNTDYKVGLSDAVIFTDRYLTAFGAVAPEALYDSSVDLNKNNQIDQGDYDCSKQPIANAEYSCNLSCAAQCGDAKIQKRLGEQCDDGNIVDGDGCSSTCQEEFDFERCVIQDADFVYDGFIKLDDAVIFTSLYLSNDFGADLNHDTVLNDFDVQCMDQFVAIGASYPLPVAPVASFVSGGTLVRPLAVVSETKVNETTEQYIDAAIVPQVESSQIVVEDGPVASPKKVVKESKSEAKIAVSEPIKITSVPTIVSSEEQTSSFGGKMLKVMQYVSSLLTWW